MAILNVEVRVESAARGHDDIVAGPSAFITEQLLNLANFGFDGFNLIVAGDALDEQHRALAAEVVPALRQY